MKKTLRILRPPHEAGGGLGKSRIEAFSDGVFAVAITLLALEIKVPEAAAGRSLTEQLGALWPQFASYILTFFIVGVYWVAHHLMLAAAKRIDKTLLWLNLLFLMCIVLIPFSAQLLGQHSRVPVAVMAYGANLVVSSLALILIWNRIVTCLLAPHTSPLLVRLAYSRTAWAMVIYGLAILLAFWNTQVSLTLYWLGPISYMFLQISGDRFHRKHAEKDSRLAAPNSASESIAR